MHHNWLKVGNDVRHYRAVILIKTPDEQPMISFSGQHPPKVTHDLYTRIKKHQIDAVVVQSADSRSHSNPIFDSLLKKPKTVSIDKKYCKHPTGTQHSINRCNSNFAYDPSAYLSAPQTPGSANQCPPPAQTAQSNPNRPNSPNNQRRQNNSPGQSSTSNSGRRRQSSGSPNRVQSSLSNRPNSPNNQRRQNNDLTGLPKKRSGTTTMRPVEASLSANCRVRSRSP